MLTAERAAVLNECLKTDNALRIVRELLSAESMATFRQCMSEISRWVFVVGDYELQALVSGAWYSLVATGEARIEETNGTVFIQKV